jgi:hypothetical protein
MPTLAKPAEIFFSYSHRDEELRNELEKHLAILQRQKRITCWHDRRILAGQEWAGEIDDHLRTADVILLLISADFLSSNYCYELEMKEAMRRHEAGEARVIPIILRPISSDLWRSIPLGRLQALPKDARPVTDWPSWDKAFVNITDGLLKIFGEDPAATVLPPPPLAAPPPAPPPPLPEKTNSVRKGFEALVELLRNDPAVRDEVVKFESEFAAAREQIDVLGDYKELHDLLHELQVHSYNVIAREARHFPEDEALTTLAEYELRLGNIVQRLDDVTSRKTFPKHQVAWMRKLHEARQALVEAIDGVVPEKLANALKLMKDVISVEPSKVDTRMTAKAEGLRLGDLAEAMMAICAKALAAGLQPDRISEFQQGAKNLELLNNRVQELTQMHNQWQAVDDELRRVEQLLDGDVNELVNSWPDLQQMMLPLYDSEDSPRDQAFRAEGVRLDGAIRARDPFKVKQFFRRYRGHATDRFYEVDKNLRDQSGELRVVGAPLASVLNILRSSP